MAENQIEARLAALEAQMSRLQAENEQLRGQLAAAPANRRHGEASPGAAGDGALSRRGLIISGAGAAAAAAVGFAAAAPQAAAANGNSVTLGSASNTASSPTLLTFDNGGSMKIGDYGFGVIDKTGGVALDGHPAIGGHANGANFISGVQGVGTAGSTGVWAASDSGTGLYALSSSGTGVYASSNSFNALTGMSQSGYGVSAHSWSSLAVDAMSEGTHGVRGNTGGGYSALEPPASGVLGSSDTFNGVSGASDSATGVAGMSSTGYGVTGVSHAASGIPEPISGVVGDSDSNIGVTGMSSTNAGVVGLSASATGVLALSATGTALSAQVMNASSAGTALDAGTGGTGYAGHLAVTNTASTADVLNISHQGPGRGARITTNQAQLLLLPRTGDRQPPATDSVAHLRGELLSDGAGSLWCCVAGGTPGTWRKVSGPTAAGALHVLPLPVRVYDSRSGTSPSVGPKTPLAANTARTLDVTVNSSGVPVGATAVMANLLVVNAVSGNGNLTIWANGVAKPNANNMVWGGSTGRFSSLALTAVDAAARVQVEASIQTDFVLDIVGYHL
jgi:hypothetical protein